VALEEAPRQFGQGFFAFQPALRAGQAFIQQGVGELLAAPGPAADDRVLLGAHHQVRQALHAARLDAGFAQLCGQFLPGEVAATLQRGTDGGIAARVQGIVEFQAAVVGGHFAVQPGGRKGQHPAQIFGQHKMPGGAHDVRAHNFAGVEGGLHTGGGERGRAQPQRPFGAFVILRLDRAQPAHHFRRAGEVRLQQVLMDHALADEGGLIGHSGR